VRDPDFAVKAARVLDLYAGICDGNPLDPNDFVVCADEKTSILARCRCHPTLPPGRARIMRIEHDYQRKGALAYLAAWDVHRGQVAGRCEDTTGIKPFARLVEQVMTTQPYASADRVFWIVDNGSSPPWSGLDPADAQVMAQRAPGPPARARLLAGPDPRPPRRIRDPLQRRRQALRLAVHSELDRQEAGPENEEWGARSAEREARRAAIPFPGLAPATDGSGAARTAALRSIRAARIGLIAARRPADVLPKVGWTCFDDPAYEDGIRNAVWIGAILRSWESRFGARLLTVGPGAEIRLLVQRPPRTLEAAGTIAAEHSAFCTECGGDGLRTVREIAPALVDAPIWTFWWD
jgi:hypothetical protein